MKYVLCVIMGNVLYCAPIRMRSVSLMSHWKATLYYRISSRINPFRPPVSLLPDFPAFVPERSLCPSHLNYSVVMPAWWDIFSQFP